MTTEWEVTRNVVGSPESDVGSVESDVGSVESDVGSVEVRAFVDICSRQFRERDCSSRTCPHNLFLALARPQNHLNCQIW